MQVPQGGFFHFGAYVYLVQPLVFQIAIWRRIWRSWSSFRRHNPLRWLGLSVCESSFCITPPQMVAMFPPGEQGLFDAVASVPGGPMLVVSKIFFDLPAEFQLWVHWDTEEVAYFPLPQCCITVGQSHHCRLVGIQPNAARDTYRTSTFPWIFRGKLHLNGILVVMPSLHQPYHRLLCSGGTEEGGIGKRVDLFDGGSVR
mmetsp:Transcript_33989/g.73472  ORF Transcript_33989/g.73472 Transcript_33989/m.73472 type:complete len:200 (-) Transcript_33989:1011-1610(-)